MGSTLESAIVFCIVLVTLVTLLLYPLDLCGECVQLTNNANKELAFYFDDDGIVKHKRIVGVSCESTSPEELCTFLTGISENYRIIYGTIEEVVFDE